MSGTAPLQLQPFSRSVHSAVPNATAGARPEVAQSVPISDATLVALAEAIAKKMLIESGDGDGRTGAAPVANLRASTMSLEQASETLAGIVNKLPRMLAALLGTQDPIQGEEGAEMRAAEGASAQLGARTTLDSAVVTSTAVPVTGTDADIGDRSANAGMLIMSSSFSNLLALLRQLLLEFERVDRENSARMVIAQRKLTITAGELGVDKSIKAFAGALAGAGLTLTFGGAAVKKSFEATTMQTNSIERNLNAANKAKIVNQTGSGGIRTGGTPSSQMREARSLDGNAAPTAKGTERAAADLQADIDVDRHGIDASAKHNAWEANEDFFQSEHARQMAEAQGPLSHSMMLNMMAPAVSGSATAGFQIAAEMTEAERQLALQVADVFRRIADEQQDHAAKTRDMRDAAAQLFESMLNLMSSTSSHIISKC